MYLHPLIIRFYHFVIVKLQTHFLTIQFLPNNRKKACTELYKKCGKKANPKNRNGQILSTF